MKHVRIEWCGAEIAPGGPLAGLSLFAVGNLTQVEDVQVRFGADDGVELMGGAVPLKRVIVDACAGDMFDYSFGWSGWGQFGIGRAKADAAGENGIELDNTEVPPGTAGFGDTPITRPIITNVTLVGPDDPSSTGTGVGLLLRRGAGSRLYNFIVQGFEAAGLDVDDGGHLRAELPGPTLREVLHLFPERSDRDGACHAAAGARRRPGRSRLGVALQERIGDSRRRRHEHPGYGPPAHGPSPSDRPGLPRSGPRHHHESLRAADHQQLVLACAVSRSDAPGSSRGRLDTEALDPLAGALNLQEHWGQKKSRRPGFSPRPALHL